MSQLNKQTMKIATHDSGTGEPSLRWYHRLLVPFSRCQLLNLTEQYEHGCRYFDLRVRKSSDGRWRLCHGLWQSSTTLTQAFDDLMQASLRSNDSVYAMITYEGSLTTDQQQQFLREMKELVEGYPMITLTEINCKLPHWTLISRLCSVPFEAAYVKIVGWKCLLPIPFIWQLITEDDDMEFNSDIFTMVDFL